MKVINKKDSVVLFQENGGYGVLDIEKNIEICKKSIYIKSVKEEFEHYWRNKYFFQETNNNNIFLDTKGFSRWDSFIKYWKSSYWFIIN